MYQLIPLHSCDYLFEISLKANVPKQNVNTEQRDEIGVAVQVGSECELNSWPDISVS